MPENNETSMEREKRLKEEAWRNKIVARYAAIYNEYLTRTSYKEKHIINASLLGLGSLVILLANSTEKDITFHLAISITIASLAFVSALLLAIFGVFKVDTKILTVSLNLQDNEESKTLAKLEKKNKWYTYICSVLFFVGFIATIYTYAHRYYIYKHLVGILCQ